ncbi:hypothetical protein, partial [Bacillus horti]
MGIFKKTLKNEPFGLVDNSEFLTCILLSLFSDVFTDDRPLWVLFPYVSNGAGDGNIQKDIKK